MGEETHPHIVASLAYPWRIGLMWRLDARLCAAHAGLWELRQPAIDLLLTRRRYSHAAPPLFYDSWSMSCSGKLSFGFVLLPVPFEIYELPHQRWFCTCIRLFSTQHDSLPLFLEFGAFLCEAAACCCVVSLSAMGVAALSNVKMSTKLEHDDMAGKLLTQISVRNDNAVVLNSYGVHRAKIFSPHPRAAPFRLSCPRH